MTVRSSISLKKRATVFRDANGLCHICTRKIGSTEPWHLEHIKALALGGPDTLENMRPAHIDCHAGKTKSEIKIIRKADRQMKKHFGIKADSKWPKQKFKRDYKDNAKQTTVRF